MDQAALAKRIGEVLREVPGVGSAFIGGSHGRDEADAYSDVDVYVVVANADDVPDALGRVSQVLERIAPILFSKTLPNARTINCITDDWLRFDLTVVNGFELAFLTGAFDKLARHLSGLPFGRNGNRSRRTDRAFGRRGPSVAASGRKGDGAI